MFDSERMVQFVRDYLRQAAGQGRCVVVGRGAGLALTGVSGVFNVFIYASLKRKIQWFEEHFPEHAKEAEQEIIATDKRRAAYVRQFYQQEWSDRRLYHLMMNSCMGCDAMVKATIEAAALTSEVRADQEAHVV